MWKTTARTQVAPGMGASANREDELMPALGPDRLQVARQIRQPSAPPPGHRVNSRVRLRDGAARPGGARLGVATPAAEFYAA